MLTLKGQMDPRLRKDDELGLFSERVLNPLDALLGNGVQQYYVATTQRRSTLLAQVVARSSEDAPLFVAIDAGQCAAERVRFAHSNFGEDDNFCVAHDQINFAVAAAIILRDEF